MKITGRRLFRHACALGAAVWILAARPAAAGGTGESLGYHEIQVDDDGAIVPWYSENPGVAYDHGIDLVWNWWKNLETCPNGVNYSLQHQVWRPTHDPRGLGGDQIAMALSSWYLLYAYSGDPSVLENMRYLADYYLANSLSPSVATWGNLPYPYNLDVHSGVYDGDMVRGPGILQPDKAGSLGAELLVLYEITGNQDYLSAAVAIADTLSLRVVPGDATHSPWPFRVEAQTNFVTDAYTTNWTGALRLFEGLIRLGVGNFAAYQHAHQMVSTWLRTYPIRNQTWGPFFEDVDRWSDTEINAGTMAWYLLEHPSWSPTWETDARAALDWSYDTLANFSWSQYGAIAIEEQTAYQVPGNSHTARHWSLELLYAEKSGDLSRKIAAIRGLNWATYMVDFDGKNRYPQDDIWLTDGYGDYVRHYLRAMASAPELAPAAENHLLRSSAVVRSVAYSCNAVTYVTSEFPSRELLRLGFEPLQVTAGGVALPRFSDPSLIDEVEGYTFEAGGDVRGVLRVRHDRSANVSIVGLGGAPAETARDLVFEDARTMRWALSSDAFAYNVYRGNLGGGGFTYDHVCLRTRVTGSRVQDRQIPAAGRGFYYLVSAVGACGEGTLGSASSGASRPLLSACP
jgi:hypothetical protein